MERQAVQWIDGHKKTGGDGTGSDDTLMGGGGYLALPSSNKTATLKSLL